MEAPETLRQPHSVAVWVCGLWVLLRTGITAQVHGSVRWVFPRGRTWLLARMCADDG